MTYLNVLLTKAQPIQEVTDLHTKIILPLAYQELVPLKELLITTIVVWVRSLGDSVTEKLDNMITSLQTYTATVIM